MARRGVNLNSVSFCFALQICRVADLSKLVHLLPFVELVVRFKLPVYSLNFQPALINATGRGQLELLGQALVAVRRVIESLRRHAFSFFILSSTPPPSLGNTIPRFNFSSPRVLT